MKAILEIANDEKMHQRALEVARNLAAGKAQEADLHIGFESAAQLLAELTPERLRTLETLRSTGAQSVYALAKALGRNYSNVHGDIARMMALGLVEREGNTVRAPFDELEIHVPLLAQAA
ncbi:MAG: MarR family transcriptional regulator [Pseudomonadales bacterium]|jgi:predicted transcriptional regulator|nr:MarR family transcriptional regulator [Pseudomonadales bacterium]